MRRFKLFETKSIEADAHSIGGTHEAHEAGTARADYSYLSNSMRSGRNSRVTIA
jgi:hypothetical protein